MGSGPAAMRDGHSQPDSDQPTTADTAASEAAPVLSYASFDANSRTVRVGRYANEIEAALPASLLESMGIGCQILNSNVNGLGMPYSGMSDVELFVHEKDADAAREILSCPDDELEPTEDPADMTPVLGDDGRLIHLATVASFGNIRSLREATLLLASSRLRIYPPIMRRRATEPTGKPRPFVLKVAEEDREVAESLLRSADAEEGDNEDPRCPKCNSWRVYPVSRFMASVKAFFGLGAWPQKQIECLACRYRGAPEEFGVHS